MLNLKSNLDFPHNIHVVKCYLNNMYQLRFVQSLMRHSKSDQINKRNKSNYLSRRLKCERIFVWLRNKVALLRTVYLHGDFNSAIMILNRTTFPSNVFLHLNDIFLKNFHYKI